MSPEGTALHQQYYLNSAVPQVQGSLVILLMFYVIMDDISNVGHVFILFYVFTVSMTTMLSALS